MKSLPKSLLNQILEELNPWAELPVDERIAAFDADGTLWSTDLGEQFFEYQLQSGKLEGLPADPWAYYENLKVTQSPQAAFLWLAQINKGQKISEVREWAKDCLANNSPTPIFDFQGEIIEKLRSMDFKIYIVTASIAWAVEPAAALFGLAPESVIGVRTQIKNGYVTEVQDGIITYKAGKVDALLAQTNQRPPLFVSGNTEGDLALLESSKGSRFVVASARPDDSNYPTEQRMQKLAAERGWFHFDLTAR